MRTLRVLIAEDTKIMRTILEKNLKSISPEILIKHATNGKEALINLLDCKKNNVYYDMLFLDLNMPELSGYNVASYLKTNDMKDMLVVIISSDITEKNRQILEEMGIKHFLGKPFDKERFTQMVEPFVKRLQSE
jgi:chemosensory pili system protein ChpA (sensor histidine kinase/response regulator)